MDHIQSYCKKTGAAFPPCCAPANASYNAAATAAPISLVPTFLVPGTPSE
jgi:hypothetical protein